MELARKEYPEVLASLPPSQAVAILNERVKRIGKLNTEVSEWIQERRKVEEAYAQGLKKLSRKHPPDELSELGIFASPWGKIVHATGLMATAHQRLAQRVEADVERPLKEFTSKNREMQALSTIQGNIAAIAKEIEITNDKADKLKRKGAKASASKVATATSDLESANAQWISQAPFIFEALQSADETRLNHLRDVLTQFQTHELDWVEQTRAAAEQCVNELLNVETSDETSMFVARASEGRPRAERQRSRTIASNTVPSSMPAASPDDSASLRSRVSAGAARTELETRPERLGGLRRLGTVIGRRKNSTPSARPSPDKRTSDKYASLDARLPEVPPLPTMGSSTSMIGATGKDESWRNQREIQKSKASQHAELPSAEMPLADRDSPSIPHVEHPKGVNGTRQEDTRSFTAGSLEALAPANNSPSVELNDGFTKPALMNDPISQAEQEAAVESAQNTLKLDIRETPIQEEDDDAETAIANVASALRAQAAPNRRSGTPRGRRDVRNTVFIPSPQIADVGPSDSPMFPPPKAPRFNASLVDDQTSSDAQSVRSARSLNSVAGTKSVRHPEMAGKGLNSSVVEAVSASFDHGQLSKAVIMGEMALIYNHSDSTPFPGSESVRLENFHVLEKVALNPTTVSSVPDKSGEYMVKLSQLTRTTIAFKYQLHLSESNIATHVPIILAPSWKIEPHQTSVILHYSLNPSFRLPAGGKLNFHHVTFIIHLEGARASGCQSKPVGTFSKERSLIFWRLGDVTLEAGATPVKLLARFTTATEAKPGSVDARWEISGDAAAGLGSQLRLSQLESSTNERESTNGSQDDPFADDSRAAVSRPTWKEVPVVRRLVSGKYAAT